MAIYPGRVAVGHPREMDSATVIRQEIATLEKRLAALRQALAVLDGEAPARPRGRRPGRPSGPRAGSIAGRALAVLKGHRGPMHIGAIAKALRAKRADIASSLDRMVRAGTLRKTAPGTYQVG